MDLGASSEVGIMKYQTSLLSRPGVYMCPSLIFIHSLIHSHCLEPTICVLGITQGAESTVKAEVDMVPSLWGTYLKKAKSILKQSRHLHATPSS